MPDSSHRVLLIALMTDVFPPRSGGSGWSTYYLGKALLDAGHRVLVLRPLYDQGVARAVLRWNQYGGLRVEEVLVPGPPAWAVKSGLGRVWSHRQGGKLLEVRARKLALSGQVDVLHGQHAVSGVAASRAARKARAAGARVASLCTVRDYWPLCPTSTRLFDTEDGSSAECFDCHRMGTYVCCSLQGKRSPLALPVAYARWLNTIAGSRELALCDGVITVSRYVRDELARSRRIATSKLHTVPNLVDLPSVALVLSGDWPLYDISPKDSFLLFAGKLDVNKGAWMLPRLVERSGVQMPVVVAGDGPLRGRIEAEAGRRGLDFRFYSWLDNDAVLRLMHKARVLLFPSAWQEPLSRVLLEGCAAGAAIVALDTGGTRDVLTHDSSGWLATDEPGFVEGIREVAVHDSLNARLRIGARRQAERKFAAPVVGAQMVELYRKLLAVHEDRGT